MTRWMISGLRTSRPWSGGLKNSSIAAGPNPASGAREYERRRSNVRNAPSVRLGPHRRHDKLRTRSTRMVFGGRGGAIAAAGWERLGLDGDQSQAAVVRPPGTVPPERPAHAGFQVGEERVLVEPFEQEAGERPNPAGQAPRRRRARSGGRRARPNEPPVRRSGRRSRIRRSSGSTRAARPVADRPRLEGPDGPG